DRSFEIRLDEHRKTELRRPQVIERFKKLPARGAYAVLLENQLGHLFVESDGQRVGVGSSVGKAQLLEERRVESLSKTAAASFRGVEDQVRRVRLEPGHGSRGRPRNFESFPAVTEPLDGARQRVDRFLAVELRLLLGVGQPQVEGQGDAQRFPLPDIPPRSFSSLSWPGARTIEGGSDSSAAPATTFPSVTCVDAHESPRRKPSGSRSTFHASIPPITITPPAKATVPSCCGIIPSNTQRPKGAFRSMLSR